MNKQTNQQDQFEADISRLASQRFGGFEGSISGKPPCLGDVQPQQFELLVDHFLSMDDENLSAIVAMSPKEMREIGTACHQMSTWHQGVAEAYSVLMSRIACCVAKDIKRLEAAA